MTHTVHPYSHRLGIIKDWKSRWFSLKQKYRDFLKSDTLIREYLEKRLVGMYVASIEMERSEKTLRIIIETSRPGMIIGRNGEGSAKLRDDVLKFINKHKLSASGEVKIDIKEIRSPESNAAIVAQMIAEGLVKRLPFRRVAKQTIDKVMANRDVQGVKIIMAGRLGGAEMARIEKLKRGRIPLQTFRADIDFYWHEALLPYGKIGIRVWIYRGEIFEKK
ncbi:MAG: 30S ribosomal protein S3 [Patescibacteria group bacterium]